MSWHIMRSCLSVFTMLTVVTTVHSQDCVFRQEMTCLTRLLVTIHAATNYSATCLGQLRGEIEQCVPPQSDCSQDTNINIQKKQAEDNLNNKCNELTLITTRPPTTTLPPFVCNVSNSKSLDETTSHIDSCLGAYSKLANYEYANKLHRFGMCSAVQSFINCMMKKDDLNRCPQLKEIITRAMLAHINFGHLLKCDLKIDGKNLHNRNTDQECNLWDWLRCHDNLFRVIQGLDVVSDNTDLNSIITLKAGETLQNIAKNAVTSCTAYSNVNWVQIKQCRARLADRCSMLYQPREDALWVAVKNVVSELKTGVYDKLSTLVKIEDICSADCVNIPGRKAKIDTCISDNVIATSILSQANSNTNIHRSDNCASMVDVKDCLLREVGNCRFLIEQVASTLKYQVSLKLAMDVCRINLQSLQSDQDCPNENTLTEKILSLGNLGGSTRESFLHAAHKEIVCALMQFATNNYEQFTPACHVLERKYWAAERPIVHLANYIFDCGTSYINGGLNVQPINIETCNLANWVTCLNPLWTALGVPSTGGKLSLDGFKALMAVAWDADDQTTRKTRCKNIKNLAYSNMKSCLVANTHVCDYANLTLPNGKTYENVFMNPLDIDKLESHIKNACTEGCTSKEIGNDLRECLTRYTTDQSFLTSYPLDILFGDLLREYKKDKCNTIKQVRSCINYYLNPAECPLYGPTLIQTAEFQDALIVCENPPPPPPPPTITDSAPKTQASLWMAAVALMVMYYTHSML